MSGLTHDTVGPLCELCQQFTTDLINTDFELQDNFPADGRWSDTRASGEKYRFGYGFQHHKTIAELAASAASCTLCRVIHDHFEQEGPDGDSCLGLFPFSQESSVGLRLKRRVVATFADDQAVPYKPRHVFRVNRILPYASDIRTKIPQPMHWEAEYDFSRAIPDSTMSQDAFDTARFWLRECLENHPKCHNDVGTLPKRVIDVGTALENKAALYVTKGERKPYVALSHCWGGNIPCKMTTNTLKDYQVALPMDELPQNFKDAIALTRELGIQSLWVDALCIIQDSAEDWESEAAKMASVYNDALLTVSALDSQCSTAGFLQPRRYKSAVISRDFAIQSTLLDFTDAIENCILNTRGWCMQERLLSPLLLHFGQDQMFWECRTITARESGGHTNSNRHVGVSTTSYNYSTSNFTDVRKTFSAAPPTYIRSWYQIVEEFSYRSLTYGNDKLPALAGVASRFQSVGLAGAYVAGLWTQDLEASIFWGARVKTLPMQKASGFHDSYVLTKPVGRKVPSWSWTSVDGPIQFHNVTQDLPADSTFKILDVEVAHGLNDSTAATVEGSLKVRGHIARMRFGPPKEVGPYHTVNVGTVEVENAVFTTHAIMDFERGISRDVWVLITSQRNPRILLLEEVDADTFRRVGWAGRYHEHEVGPELFKHFYTKEFTLI
ncbi:hypothetical protein EsH8_IV_000257 [Colletotrichum jinshuiense]